MDRKISGRKCEILCGLELEKQHYGEIIMFITKLSFHFRATVNHLDASLSKEYKTTMADFEKWKSLVRKMEIVSNWLAKLGLFTDPL